MTDLQQVLARADQNLSSSLEKLFELLRIQSISTDPAYKAECRKAAEWLVAYLEALALLPRCATRRAIRWWSPIMPALRRRAACSFLRSLRRAAGRPD